MARRTQNGLKKILMIIPAPGSGGAGRSFCKLSNELNKKYLVKNVVFNRDWEEVYPLDAETLSLEVSGGGNALSKAINFLRRVSRLRKIKKDFGAEVSISFLEGADYVNILSAENDKVILSVRGSKYYDGNIQGLTGLLRKRVLIPLLYKRASTIICVNKGIIHELDNYFGLGRVHKKLIHNYYDFEEIVLSGRQSLPKRYKLIESSRYVVSSSRIAREKNIPALISVFAKLKQQGYPGKLVIVGNGPLFKNLPEYCINSRLTLHEEALDNLESCDVIATGEEPNPFRFIYRAECFLMASESEGFPNSLVEAMILGTPVVSSDCPWGPAEILGTGGEKLSPPHLAEFGILLPMLSTAEGSVNYWAQHIYDLLCDPELLDEYRKRSRKGSSVYTKEKALSIWDEVINS